MASRYKDKAQRGPRLRGLERRSSGCRRKQARRKSDDSNRPVVSVQPAIAAGKKSARQVVTDPPAAMPGDPGLLRSILQQIPVSIMLCDRDLKISFVNRALEKMLLQREAQIRQQLPGVDPRNLVGTGIERFKTDSGCASAYAKVRLDTHLVVDLSATAIVSPEGECMGRMVLWTEVDERTRTDAEVLELLAGIKSTGDAQARDIARLSRTVTRLGESIEANRSSLERGAAEASPPHSMRRNLRIGQSRSRRTLVSRTDD